MYFIMCKNNRPSEIVPIRCIIIIISLLSFCATEECTLPECNYQAKRLRASINKNVSPCDDFVEFACGMDFEKFDNIDSKRDSGLLVPTTYRIHLWWMRKMIQKRLSESPHIDDSRGIKLAKIFWKNCINTTSENALRSVRILLKRLGGWPLITKNWNEKLFTWDKFSRCARRLGFLPRMFIFVGVDVDSVRKPWHPNDTITLTIEKPKYFDTSTVHDVTYFTIAEFITDDVEEPKISNIDEALDFSQTLNKLDCAPDEMKSEVMSIIQLQERFPIIDWFKYIKAMMRPRQAKYLSDYNCIYVDICYTSAFTRFIPTVDKKIQGNYAMMAIINDLFTLIRPQLPLVFATDRETVAEICFDATATVFKKALDVIIGRAPDSKLMMKMGEVENQIYNRTLHILQTIPWMDDETKSLARRKLDLVSFQNPFPDDIFDSHYFSRLNFESHNTLPVILREINIFLVDNYYLQAGRSKIQYGIYQQDEQMMRAVFRKSISPNVASAKPDIFDKTIYMPAGAIVHRQLSIHDELDFINYALIGVQLGEALSHHIYHKGAHIDDEGKWHVDSWWSKTTQKQFMSRQSCHTIGPMKPIADASIIFGLIGGVEIAYMSVFDQCLTKACTTTLKGLKFNTRQLFWLAFISSDCDRNLKQRYNTVLSHNDNFIKDFQCPKSSKMYISDGCKMWIA